MNKLYLIILFFMVFSLIPSVFAAESIPSEATIISTTTLSITINVPINNYYYSTDSLTYDIFTNLAADLCRFSLDGASNVTMDMENDTHFSYLDNSISEGSHNIIFFCNDSSTWASSSATFYIDLSEPTVYFGPNPPDEYNSSSNNIVLESYCIDNLGLSSLQIWSNSSGSWSKLIENTNPQNNTIWDAVVTFNNGVYTWGAYCVDKSGRFDWTNTNRTLIITGHVPGTPIGSRKTACTILKIVTGIMALLVLLVIIALLISIYNDYQYNGYVDRKKVIGLTLMVFIIVAIMVVFLPLIWKGTIAACPSWI